MQKRVSKKKDESMEDKGIDWVGRKGDEKYEIPSGSQAASWKGIAPAKLTLFSCH